MRYERKYYVSRSRSSIVEMKLNASLANWEAPYPERRINNLYFDTASLALAHDNIDGVGDRCKWRIRWYGEFNDSSGATLEKKFKHGEVGGKLHHPLPENFLPHIDKTTSADQPVDQENGTDRMPANLFPMLYNSYVRRYYSLKGTSVRLTIDRGITFFPSKRHPRYGLSGHKGQIDQFIIELKYDIEDQSRAVRIASNLNLRASRVSKYVLGLSTMGIVDPGSNYP